MKHIESIKEFGGWLNRYQHQSAACLHISTTYVSNPMSRRHDAVPFPAAHRTSGTHN